MGKLSASSGMHLTTAIDLMTAMTVTSVMTPRGAGRFGVNGPEHAPFQKHASSRSQRFCRYRMTRSCHEDCATLGKQK